MKDQRRAELEEQESIPENPLGTLISECSTILARRKTGTGGVTSGPWKVDRVFQAWMQLD
jgi:hypothetical protein